LGCCVECGVGCGWCFRVVPDGLCRGDRRYGPLGDLSTCHVKQGDGIPQTYTLDTHRSTFTFLSSGPLGVDFGLGWVGGELVTVGGNVGLGAESVVLDVLFSVWVVPFSTCLGQGGLRSTTRPGIGPAWVSHRRRGWSILHAPRLAPPRADSRAGSVVLLTHTLPDWNFW
jgi:hypothetical protein